MGTILVLEKDELLLELAASVLRKEGHRVIGRENLQQAREVLAVGKVDLILTDLFCPPYSYLDTALQSLQLLKELAPDVPVVLFTDWLGLAERRAQSEGFVGLVRKPFELNDLIDKVRAGMGRDVRTGREHPEGWEAGREPGERIRSLDSERRIEGGLDAEPSLIGLEG